MITQIKNNIKLLRFANLIKNDKVIHFSSTRVGGVSSGHLFSLNLGHTVNDSPKNVNQNLESLALAIDIKKSQLVFPKQTHSSNIGIVKSVNEIFPDTDALITNVPEICICVRTADCTPIFLYDPVQKAIAAIHSGWKGTVQRISMKTIRIMQREFGTRPENIIAGIGPSIGPDVYEVGPELIEQFNKLFRGNQIITPITDSEKGFLNLWKANKQILIESGIPEDNIEISEMCTFSNSELFYSARRDKNKTGRLASGIMIKEQG